MSQGLRAPRLDVRCFGFQRLDLVEHLELLIGSLRVKPLTAFGLQVIPRWQVQDGRRRDRCRWPPPLGPGCILDDLAGFLLVGKACYDGVVALFNAALACANMRGLKFVVAYIGDPGVGKTKLMVTPPLTSFCSCTDVSSIPGLTSFSSSD